MKRSNEDHRGLIRIEGYHDLTGIGVRTVRIDDIVDKEYVNIGGLRSEFIPRLRFNDTKVIRTQMIGMISGAFGETYQQNKETIDELIEMESQHAEQYVESTPLGNDDLKVYYYDPSSGDEHLIGCQ